MAFMTAGEMEKTLVDVLRGMDDKKTLIDGPVISSMSRHIDHEEMLKVSAKSIHAKVNSKCLSCPKLKVQVSEDMGTLQKTVVADCDSSICIKDHAARFEAGELFGDVAKSHEWKHHIMPSFEDRRQMLEGRFGPFDQEWEPEMASEPELLSRERLERLRKEISDKPLGVHSPTAKVMLESSRRFGLSMSPEKFKGQLSAISLGEGEPIKEKAKKPESSEPVHEDFGKFS